MWSSSLTRPIEAAVRRLRSRLALSRRALALLSLAYLGLIWVLSSTDPPGPELVRGAALKHVVEVAFNLAHVPLFAGLAFLILLTLATHDREIEVGPRVVCLTIGLTALSGLVDEFHQSFTPGRSPSPFDLASDVLGSLFAVVFTRHLYLSGRLTGGRRALALTAVLLALSLASAELGVVLGDPIDFAWRRARQRWMPIPPTGLVSGFESARVWSPATSSTGYDLESAKDQASEGLRALRVILPAGDSPGVTTRALPPDWSTYQGLSVSIHVDGESPLSIAIHVRDVWDRSLEFDRQLAPGANPVRAAFAEGRGRIDLEAVKRISFFVRTGAEPRAIVLDDLRLWR